MSSTSFQESAVSASGSKEPECEPSRSVKSSRSVKQSCDKLGQPSQSIEISDGFPHSTLAQTEFPLMSSAADSRAKTLAWQETAPELTDIVVVSGENTPELLAKYDRASSSWRTSQLCLVGDLSEFSETWPRSGLMRSGIAYQRPTLVPGNFGTEFGLWPTPNATAFKGGRLSPRRGVANPERNNWQDWCSLVLGQRYPAPETAEQVMGLPIGHTEIKQLEIPLSHKFQNLSGGQS